MRLENKVAIVTGSGQGIGETYAKGIAAAGASVVVAEIQKEKGQRVADEIVAAGGKATFVEVDVASDESTAAMAKATTEARTPPGTPPGTPLGRGIWADPGSCSREQTNFLNYTALRLPCSGRSTC